MCGLFAYTGKTRAGAEDHHRNLVRDMMIEAGRRGPHAWGFTSIGEDGLVRYAVKNMGPLERVVPWVMSHLNVDHTFMGHARLATGQQIREYDTQPLHTIDNRFAVAHNGTVRNPERFFEEYSYTPNTGNDSEALLCIIQHEGLRRGMARIQEEVRVGNMQIALIAYSADEGFAAFRSYHPLYIKPVEEGFYLCSRLVGVNLTFQPLPEGEIFLCRV